MYKEVGKWWNDNNVDLIEIDGTVYALSGWNGETYNNCWICKNEYEASKEEYVIKPVYEKINGEFEIVDYIVL